jgi:hypothetical protein
MFFVQLMVFKTSYIHYVEIMLVLFIKHIKLRFKYFHETLIVAKQGNKFRVFCGTQKFITILSRARSCVVFLSISRKMTESASDSFTTAPFHIFANSLFTDHSNIRATENAVNTLEMKTNMNYV